MCKNMGIDRIIVVNSKDLPPEEMKQMSTMLLPT